LNYEDNQFAILGKKINLLLGETTMSKLNEIDMFYPAEAQQRYGVVGLRLELFTSMTS
jgi:hypothetical protein